VSAVPSEAAEQVEIQTKYEGYIARQQSQVTEFSRLESIAIPADLDYMQMHALSMEGREKLGRIQPVSIGQAARIPGITPADLTALMILLEQRKRACRIAAGVV
jgi:tRNA uridine 5-carboxymethylaminomethyl modification enzyme